MEQELTFRIILEDPPPGVDYGLQKGAGNDYEVVQKQRSKSGDLTFEFTARVKEGKDGQPVLLGPFTQGPPHERFAYLDIGTYAGQTDTPWSRRLKIPFRDITWDVVKKASKRVLETRVPGKGKRRQSELCDRKTFRRLESRLVRALKCALEVNGFQTGRPVLDGYTIRLRSLLLSLQPPLIRNVWFKLEPGDPRAVVSLFSVTAHDISGLVGSRHFSGVFL